MVNKNYPAATPAAFLRRLSLVVAMLIGGQLVFLGGVFIILSSGNEMTQPSLAPVLLLVFTAAAGVSAMAGHLIYERMLAYARFKETLQERLEAFQNATIIRFATIEAGGIMAVLGYLITGHTLFPVLLVATVAIQIMLFPTTERSITTLRMSGDEKEIIHRGMDWPQKIRIE